MTQEDKDLLLKDLCARLPYGVKFEHTDKHTLCEILSITPIYNYGNVIYFDDAINHPKKCGIDDVKPYLFPLSSMTKEQRKEYDSIIYHSVELHCDRYYEVIDVDSFEELQDFYHINHLDYRGLIPMGLAIDCTYLNIY